MGCVHLKTSEIKALTSLRMFAALLVFFHHFYPFTYTEGWFENVLIEGHIGVTIFFALSGFLISLRYYDEFAQQGLTRQKFAMYYLKRFARIYPLYFFLLVLNNVLAKPSYNLILFTLTQGFFTNIKFSGINTAWSLTVEECFYLIIPLFAIIPINFTFTKHPLVQMAFKLIVFTIILGILGVFIVIISNQFGLARLADADFMSSQHHMVGYTIFGRFFDFAVGIFVARVYQYALQDGWFVAKRSTVYSHLLSVMAILLICVATNQMHIHDSWTGGWYYNYFVAIGAGILIFSLTYERSILARFFSFWPFVYLGRVSYAVYLLQGTKILREVRWQNFSIPTSTPLMFISLFYAIATMISILLYELVEQPARKIILLLAARAGQDSQ